MNKMMLAGMATIAAVGLSAGAQAAVPQGGTINISGQIVASSCYVDTGSTNANVTLPDVDASRFANAGDTAGDTPFTITIDKCTKSAGAGTVAVAFTPDANIDTQGHLTNTGGAGTSVAVRLLDKNKSPINIQTETYTQQIARGYSTDVSSAAIPMQFYAQYFANASSVSSGTVAGMANFTLVYQ